MEHTEITLPAELSPILSHSHIAQAQMQWVTGDAVPQPYGKLLVHDHDMTSALEAFHHGPISLEVLRSESREGSYMREVVLHSEVSKQPVEYGVIEILLDSFPEDIRPLILGGEIPLGRILNESGMPYYSEPQGFFHIHEEGLRSVFPASSSGGILYGRYNHLIRGDHAQILARIIEILPLVGSSS